MENADRQWEAIRSVAGDFTGLTRSEAEELAAGLGLHPTVLDWDVIGDKPVALAFHPADDITADDITADDIIVLHLRGGVVTRAEPAP